MCDKKIQKEEKFFYEPGGHEFDVYINGDDECVGCPHRTVSYYHIKNYGSNPSDDEYRCRGLEGTLGKSIKLRMYGRS
jgi:hypothetical protein